MVALPPWLVVMLPLALLLAVVYLAWRFVRRGMGAIHRAASRGDVARLKQILLASPQAATAKDLMGLLPLEMQASVKGVHTSGTRVPHRRPVFRSPDIW